MFHINNQVSAFKIQLSAACRSSRTSGEMLNKRPLNLSLAGRWGGETPSIFPYSNHTKPFKKGETSKPSLKASHTK